MSPSLLLSPLHAILERLGRVSIWDASDDWRPCTVFRSTRLINGAMARPFSAAMRQQVGGIWHYRALTDEEHKEQDNSRSM